MKLEISSHHRSKMIKMTDEARVLKRLREDRGLSLREAARMIGKNHATLAHIEGGRMDVPDGKRLLELLNAYGVDSIRSFYDRVRNYRARLTPQEELRELVEKLSPDRVPIALEILKQVAEGRRIIAV